MAEVSGRDRALARLRERRAIALVRADSEELALRLAQVTIAAGLMAIEVAWCGEASARAIASLRETFPQCEIGAGTILSASDARAAIAAGAQFLFSPYTDGATLEVAEAADVLAIPGALTPTEIHRARKLGATAVKVFPIAAVGGVDYLRALRAPLPRVPLIPTGGVTIADACDYLKAGAIAVALSSALFPAELVRRGDWDAIASRLRKLTDELAKIDIDR